MRWFSVGIGGREYGFSDLQKYVYFVLRRVNWQLALARDTICYIFSIFLVIFLVPFFRFLSFIFRCGIRTQYPYI